MFNLLFYVHYAFFIYFVFCTEPIVCMYNIMYNIYCNKLIMKICYLYLLINFNRNTILNKLFNYL